MKKMLRLFRRTSGFTLVEMIVSIALLAILLGGIMMFVSPILRSFNDTKSDLTAENAVVCVQEYITRSIRNANQVAIFANTNTSALSSNTAYAERIAKMNTFCTSVNGVGVPKANMTYVLKCISLKYDDATGRYFLYNENVNMDSNGVIDTADPGEKVFSDCLFDDLYMTFDFKKAKNADYPAVEGAEEFRPDTLDITINSYRDTARTNLAFSGTGFSELRQIKVMLSAGGDAENYNLTIMPTDQKSFAAMTDGSRDIFIYYIYRQIGAKATP